jgi:hypothetical protein
MNQIDDILKSIAAFLYAFAIIDYVMIYNGIPIIKAWWVPVSAIVVATILVYIVYKIDSKNR